VSAHSDFDRFVTDRTWLIARQRSRILHPLISVRPQRRAFSPGVVVWTQAQDNN